MKPFPFKIAIIGLGPKGLYGFERILAQLKSNSVQETGLWQMQSKWIRTGKVLKD